MICVSFKILVDNSENYCSLGWAGIFNPSYLYIVGFQLVLIFISLFSNDF